LPWKNFGNNNIETQPKSIVNTFTMREDDNNFKKRTINENFLGHGKCLIETDNILELENHCSTLTKNNNIYFSDFTCYNPEYYNMSNQYLHINHYQHLSREYYTTIKIIRGDAAGFSNFYNIERFNRENLIFNEIMDLELFTKKATQSSIKN
jgi:hypothetical protein